MNDIHKAVLLKHGPGLTKDLMVTESLLGSMFHKKIFEEEMINMIRVCQLPSDKVYKLLELLPKRGPKAFDSFVEILEEQYDWLAKSMKESVVIDNAKSAAARQVQTEIQIPSSVFYPWHWDTEADERWEGELLQTKRKILQNKRKKLQNERKILKNEDKRLTVALEIAASNLIKDLQKKRRLPSLYRQLFPKQKKLCRKKPAPTSREDHVDIVADDMSCNFIDEQIIEEKDEIKNKLVYMEK